MNSLPILLFGTIIAGALMSTIRAREGQVFIRGVVTCQGMPVYPFDVQLWEKDIISDDFLNVTTTDPQGRFELEGIHDEYASVEPYIYIVHRCSSGAKSTILNHHIPVEYINYDDEPIAPITPRGPTFGSPFKPALGKIRSNESSTSPSAKPEGEAMPTILATVDKDLDANVAEANVDSTEDVEAPADAPRKKSNGRFSNRPESTVPHTTRRVYTPHIELYNN